MAKILTRIFLGFALISMLFTAVTAFRYPGFFRHGLVEMTQNGFHEFMIWVKFGYYYLPAFSQFEYNKETGYWDLEVSYKEIKNASSPDNYKLGVMQWHRGEFQEAIQLIEKDIDEEGESESKLFWLGMAYMRQAEAVNCFNKLKEASAASKQADHVALEDITKLADHGSSHHGMMCSLPLKVHHESRKYSEMAANTFLKLLNEYDSGDTRYKWLLNFSLMTVDQYPAAVPEEYRIKGGFERVFYGEDAAKKKEKYKDLVFTDRAREFGVDTNDTGRGVAVEDFDGDGYLDIVTGSFFSGVKLYRNKAGTGFEDKTTDSGLSATKQVHVITAADYDNDGDYDLFMGRPFSQPLLFRNKGDGVFEDVTVESGIGRATGADEYTSFSWVSAWGDVDNDGDLDLFVSHWGMPIPFAGAVSLPAMRSTLFINTNGKFEDQTDQYGLADFVENEEIIGAAFGDYDADGDQDLFLSSMMSNSSVLLDNVNGKKYKLARRFKEKGFTASFIDLDHDGNLDIFQGSVATGESVLSRAAFDEGWDKYSSGYLTVFMQRNGEYIAETDLFEGMMPTATMGASYGDLNNDGCWDFYIGTGNPSPWMVIPNMMYVGKPSGNGCEMSFENISMLNGFGTIQKGHGIVFNDFDEDGDQDIYSSLGGMWPGDAWFNQYFVNESHTNNAWVKIRLRGYQSNRSGIGAMIKVVARQNGSEQDFIRYYHMDNHTGFGSAPYQAHIGLGQADVINRIEVCWPGKDVMRIYSGEINKHLLLQETGGEAGSKCFKKTQAESMHAGL